MIVYHGSYCTIENPDVSHSRRNLDFGTGFYLTDIKDQAKIWAERYSKNNKQSILNIYNFDFEAVRENYKVKIFPEHNQEWLDFILSCRQGQSSDEYDVIIGGIANDRVYDTLELYLDNLIDRKEAIKRLQYHKPNNQICIVRQDIIENHLSFISSETNY